MRSFRGALTVTTVGALALAVAGCGPKGADGVQGSGPNPSTAMDAGLDFSEPPLPTGSDDGGTVDPGSLITHDPATCDEAAMTKSYIGCDYWPTVSFNPVWSVFDFAVVISNPSASAANITINGGGLTADSTAKVMPGTLVKIGLPWVASLKGADADAQGASTPPAGSILAAKGAYHLVSDIPVLVYQFNALEYQGGTGVDLHGANWSTCPGSQKNSPTGGCFSFSNDASLLLPSTAMTPNYIVTGVHGDDLASFLGTQAFDSGFLLITSVQDNTSITVKYGTKANVLASKDGKIVASASGSSETYMLAAGDVLELVGTSGSAHDFTGSQIQANHPVQVISGHPCMTNPQVSGDGIVAPQYSCDHVEESQLPYETWGKKYVVTAPSGPLGDVPGHTVRIYGGLTASTLTFTPAVAGAPTSIAAFAVAEFDTTTSFVVEGTSEFAIGSIQKSGAIVDPNGMDTQQGDPSLSFISAEEQYRDKYLFLAPNDYEDSYADVVAPTGANLMLDGAAVTQTATAIGNGYGVIRIKLDAGQSGAHEMTGDHPFGIQVMGYGSYTSYQYPAGLDLKVIAAAPPPIN